MKNIIVIKVGGNAADNLSEHFYQQIHSWLSAGKHILIIHGGGPQISSMSKKMNLDVKKIDGIRVTDKTTIEVVQAVLLGLVQPKICSNLVKHSIAALGLNAVGKPIIFGDYVDKAVYGQVGVVKNIDSKTIFSVLKHHVGVLSPLAFSNSKEELNINADAAAAAIANMIGAEKLVLMTDVPGVLVHSTVLDHLSKEKAERLYQKKVIKDGMMPKISAAFAALSGGVKDIQITNDFANHGTHLIAQQLA